MEIKPSLVEWIVVWPPLYPHTNTQTQTHKHTWVKLVCWLSFFPFFSLLLLCFDIKSSGYGSPFEIYHTNYVKDSLPPYWIKSKAGAWPGYTSAVLMIPEIKLGVIVQMNDDNAALFGVGTMAGILPVFEKVLWDLQPLPANPGNQPGWPALNLFVNGQAWLFQIGALQRLMFWHSFMLLDVGNLTQFEGVYVASMFLGYVNSTVTVKANEDNNTLTIRQTIGGSASGGDAMVSSFEATWVNGNKFRIQDNGTTFSLPAFQKTQPPHLLFVLLNAMICFFRKEGLFVGRSRQQPWPDILWPGQLMGRRPNEDRVPETAWHRAFLWMDILQAKEWRLVALEEESDNIFTAIMMAVHEWARIHHMCDICSQGLPLPSKRKCFCMFIFFFPLFIEIRVVVWPVCCFYIFKFLKVLKWSIFFSLLVTFFESKFKMCQTKKRRALTHKNTYIIKLRCKSDHCKT